MHEMMYEMVKKKLKLNGDKEKCGKNQPLRVNTQNVNI